MIGKILQDILNEKNMRVSELSRMIDVSNQTLYSIIKRDNMKIDFDILLKICNVLNVDVERFYAGYITPTKTIVSSPTHKNLITAFDNINKDGQKKIMEYITDLAENPKYTAADARPTNSISEEHTKTYTKKNYDYEIAAWGADGTKGKTYKSPTREIT